MGSCMSTNKAVHASHNHGTKFTKRNLKREAKDVLAAEAKNDEQLACFPGRMYANGASTAACLFSQQGRKGVNQDAMLVWEGFNSREDTTFCGVFDGHGPYGHLVARRVRDSLPLKLSTQWQGELLDKEDDLDENVADAENGCSGERDHPLPEMFEKWRKRHLRAFQVMDRELRVHPSIDCYCSGTTAVTILKQGQDLVIGNVGDSRAIMGTIADDNSLVAIPLTVDLKPNLPKEAERIRQCKGRVFALHDEPEVHRVWLPHDNSPGLAMARAFGDFCLKDFGVISVPEISYRRLTDKDQFIVLATDGVWDVLSNEEVVHIVASNATRSTSARALVEAAVHSWVLKYPTSKMDDCAVICFYLNNPISCQKTVANNEIDALPNEAPPSAEYNGDSPSLLREEAQIQNLAYVPDDDNKTVVSAPIHRGPKLNEIERGAKGKDGKTSQNSLAERLATEENEWSALDGVTRVNSLLSLPRFLLGDKRLGGSKRRK